MRKLAILFIVLSTTCNTASDEQKPWPVDLNELSTLHCRSIELKKERFSLADSIRFVQDSIIVNEKLANDLSSFKEKLKDLEIRKDILSAQSYALSDTIESKMLKVIRELNPEEKRIFNDSLNNLNRSKGCIL